MATEELLDEHFRVETMPHIWCPGCGHGIVLGALMRALEKSGFKRDKTVIVSGIGCSSRATGYLDYDTLHTTHGRALAFATGVKLANPELNVVVITGDGDASAIGGNHFIHAARRNIDITTIIFNNSIYGMTGGQYSPETPEASWATTSPYGHIERTFDLAELAKAAGASYVARGTTYHVNPLSNYMLKALKKKGFSVVEAISGCPTYFGRKNKMPTGTLMLQWQKDSAVPRTKADKLSAEEMKGKFVIGELQDIDLPEYTEEYGKVIKKAQERRR